MHFIDHEKYGSKFDFFLSSKKKKLLAGLVKTARVLECAMQTG